MNNMRKEVAEMLGCDDEEIAERTTQEQFNIVQDHLNWLNVKARLIRQWVSREILDILIPKYEEVVHWLIYPIIKD